MLLIGDMNAQIGEEREGLKQTIGPFGFPTTTNDNGESLIIFCGAKLLVIGKTFFEQKKNTEKVEISRWKLIK